MGRVEEVQKSDPDELFCLSLAGHLKGLLPKDGDMAKMRTLKTLHHLEFGDSIASADQSE